MLPRKNQTMLQAIFIALKAEVEKLGIAKLVKVPTSLNNF